MEEAPPTTNSQNGWKSHLEYCDRGFRTTGNVRVDLVRLGALCGPSNGLTRAWGGDLLVGGPESGAGLVTKYELRGAQLAAGCGRFVIAFAPHEAAQHVAIQLWSRDQLLDECRLSQSGFCPSKRMVCDPSHLETSLSTAEPILGEEAEASTAPLATRKVNVEWWAQPSIPTRPPGAELVPQTRVLPLLE